MANVFLVGLEQAAADQISQALAAQRHRIVEQKIQNVGTEDLRRADIIFADGDAAEYLRLLRRVRKELAGSGSATPLNIVVTVELIRNLPTSQ